MEYIPILRHLMVLSCISLVLASCHDDDDSTPLGPEPVIASFTHNLPSNCPTPCQVCFTNDSQNATSYAWDFGNGQTSTEANPCISYQARGSFTVVLTATRGTESSTSSQILTVGDDILRYKRDFASNSSGTITNLIFQNGYAHVLMTVDGVRKLLLFNENNEFYRDFTADMGYVENIVPSEDGGFFFAGTSNSAPSIAKFTSELDLAYQRNYPQSRAASASSIVRKNTGQFTGYIVCGQLEDDWTNDQGLLMVTDDDCTIYHTDLVQWSLSVRRIFRNNDIGNNAYVACGSWRDPSQQKMDIRLFTVNEHGVDYLPTNLYLGLDNGYDDALYDAIQYNNGSSYAAVGEMGARPLFFTTNWQDLNFSQPFILQDFPAGVTRLSGVCELANGTGFAVCGNEFTSEGWWIYLAKIAHDGSILWQKRLGNFSTYGDITATPDGGMLVGGMELCQSSACSFPVLFKLDTNGDYQ